MIRTRSRTSRLLPVNSFVLSVLAQECTGRRASSIGCVVMAAMTLLLAGSFDALAAGSAGPRAAVRPGPPLAHLGTAPIWVDTDPSCHLAGWHDVDDCLALAALLRRRGDAIRGISTVFGNSDDAVDAEILAEILRQLNLPASVLLPLRLYKGVSKSGSGSATPASRAIISALEREPLGVVALGPMTNIADVLRARPDLASRIQFIVFLGGTFSDHKLRLPEQRYLHFHDQNVSKDIDAVRCILDLGIPLYLVPFRSTVSVRVSAEEVIAALKPHEMLAAAIRDWELQWKRKLNLEGFVPFDLIAAALVMADWVYSCEPVSAAIVKPRWALSTVRQRLSLVQAERETGRWYCVPRTADIGATLLESLK